MDFIYGARIVRALTRYSDQFVHRTRHALALLRPATMDTAILSIICTIVMVVEYYNDLAPKLFQFAIDYQEWEVDNVIFAIFIMSIGFFIFSYRRVKELAGEIKARRSAALEAMKLARHDPLTGLP